MNKRIAVILLSLLLMTVALVSAQDITPLPGDEIDPDVNISWPPPVYVLRGRVELRGTANLNSMGNYFLEFRPLEFGAVVEDDESNWLPITLPKSVPVVDDVLGTWNTQTTGDGLYEIRLSVYIDGVPARFFAVSPLRIENDPPPFVVLDATEEETGARATFTPMPTQPLNRPTLAASPTALNTAPRVTAITDANVRAGDSTGYNVIGSLFAGETARVIGRSSRGNGWYYIELPDGDRGWIAPSVVTAAGNIDGTPRIDPPATSTPMATATFTPPPASGNLTGSTPSITPNPPTCNVQFRVMVNLTNNGSARTLAPAAILIQDIHSSSGQVLEQVTTTLPELNPGENFVVGGDFSVSTYYNEQHTIRVTIDYDNAVGETNENDNVIQTTYVLQQGGC